MTPSRSHTGATADQSPVDGVHHPLPGHTEPGHTEPGHTEPGHAEPGHATPGHAEPEHTTRGRADLGRRVPRRALLRGAAVAGAAAGLAFDPTGHRPALAGEPRSGVGPEPGSGVGPEPGPGAGSGSVPGSEPGSGLTLDGAPLLCEPYLLDPEPHGVLVLWHTEQPGLHQVVLAGEAVAGMTDAELLMAATGPDDRSGGKDPGGDAGAASRAGWRRYAATSQRLSRTREDAASRVPGRVYTAVTPRDVWRHLAEVRGLRPGRVPYRVVSVDGQGRATITPAYTLAPALPPHAPARLLLTSDHQQKPMTAANLESVARTAGVELDGVLMAGDCVNVPDRASEWFDSTNGMAFFATMTGRGSKALSGRTYRGAPVLQHTPIFPTPGNHEVMGRLSGTATLTDQFNDPQPTEVAARRWEELQPAGVSRDVWIAEHSWDTTTYRELFPMRGAEPDAPLCYARTVGNVFVASLFVAAIWRGASTAGRGKFSEPAATLDDTDTWGYGQFIFEPVKRGSRQYAWLERALRSRAARRARYRMVMFHHPSHGLGDNSAPALTDPVQAITLDPDTGRPASVSYSYPLADDHVLRDVEPLLDSAGVHLVLNGHSHVWNRFRNAAGVNWLETSNVGNSYGAFDVTSGMSRALPASPDHVPQGDPGRLAPVVPTIAPLSGPDGTPLPYVARNDVTVFSILDSGAGTVRSYRFDTTAPDSEPVLFDEFPLA